MICALTTDRERQGPDRPTDCVISRRAPRQILVSAWLRSHCQINSRACRGVVELPKLSQTYAEESDDQQKRTESALVLPSISELRVPLQHNFGRGGTAGYFHSPARDRPLCLHTRPACRPTIARSRICTWLRRNVKQTSNVGHRLHPHLSRAFSLLTPARV